MSETQIATSAESPGIPQAGAQQVSSYCGECGTWDAHEDVCSCCGYVFRVEAVAVAPSGE